MSWVFLLVSLYGAWFTWNVYRPRHAGGEWAVFSFFAGWLTSELPLIHIAWQAVATAGFAWLGALETWPGQIGLGVTLVSWAGLAWHLYEAHGARKLGEDALRGGLGEGFEAELGSHLGASLEDTVSSDALLRPYRIHRPDVERIKDILYRRVQGVNLRLDVYRPRGGTSNAPTLLQIHGGGWMVGSKNEQGLPIVNQLAAHGWVCFNVDYRLSPHATFPDHLIDLKAALAWIREHGAEYGANPDFVVVTGGSAGGHLAALVALTQNDPAYQPGFEEADTSVSGCIPFYGVYDFLDRSSEWHHTRLAEIMEERIMKGSVDEIPEAYHRASPLSLVDETAVPFMVIHGTHDTLVPVAEARNFVAELRAKSQSPVVYLELPRAQHAFEIFPSLRARHVVNAAERFATVLYARYLAGREGDGEDETVTDGGKADDAGENPDTSGESVATFGADENGAVPVA